MSFLRLNGSSDIVNIWYVGQEAELAWEWDDPTLPFSVEIRLWQKYSGGGSYKSPKHHGLSYASTLISILEYSFSRWC